MTKKLFAVMLLSLTLAACEPATTENNSNTNSNAKPPATSTPAPVVPSPETSVALKPQVKAGDKVKIMVKGSPVDATVLSVDEKSGKVTVKIQGEKEEKTIAITDIVKQ
jgi:ABC-type uncharacterized transport system auxiliary subunit